jgi:hypothetical protein
MEVEKLRNYISIVIIGSFVPDRITAEWVAEKGIVPEKAAQKKRTRRLERNLSVFNISNSIEVVVTNERLQVTGLVGDQDEVVSITQGIFALSDHKDVIGVGINAAMEFTFKTVSDGDRFGEFFVPMDKWKNYFRKPSVFEITLRDNADPKEIGYDKAINIRSIAPKRSTEEGNIAAVRMSVNNNFDVNDDDECRSTIKKSLELTDDFWKQSDQIISDVR